MTCVKMKTITLVVVASVGITKKLMPNTPSMRKNIRSKGDL